MNGMLSTIDIRKNDKCFLASTFNSVQDCSITIPIRDSASGNHKRADQAEKRHNEKLTSLSDMKVRFDRELNKMERGINCLESDVKIWIRKTRIWHTGSRKLSNHPERKMIY